MAGEVTTAREGRVNPVNAIGRTQNPFTKIGTTRVGAYDVEVQRIVEQDRSGRGLNLSSKLFTQIRKNGRVVAWNITETGGEKQREKWISEQRRKLKF